MKAKTIIRNHIYIQDFSKLSENPNDLNDHLSLRSYIGDEVWPTNLDLNVFLLIKSKKEFDFSKYPHISRWFSHIKSYNESEKKEFPISIMSQINSKDSINKRVRDLEQMCFSICCLGNALSFDFVEKVKRK